jgi:hypothetical protein
MDRLEAQLVRLQVQERIGNGLRHAGMLVKSSKRRALLSSFHSWHHAVSTERTCQKFLVAGGCRQSASTLARLKNKSVRGAWGKWQRAALLLSSQQTSDQQSRAWEVERGGIVAERVAAAEALSLANQKHALRTSAKVVRALQRGALVKGWRSWVKAVEAGRAAAQRRGVQGSVLLASTSKLRLKCLGRNFRRLLAHTNRLAAWAASLAFKEQAEAERVAAQWTQALRTVGAAMLSSTLDKKRFAMAILKRQVNQRREARQKLRFLTKVLIGVADASKRRVFMAWHRRFKEGKEHAHAKERSAKLLAKVALSGQDFSKARGMSKWVKATANKRAEAKLEAAAQHKSLQVLLKKRERERRRFSSERKISCPFEI